ncbi:hypothetical protein PoB_002644800 [Plakobranchus ocellatus]|uniref:Uncharacterized protein n=1 Tax=Plakobranchus ocellatus TaxID=259542 RepID=A0AAV3ZZS2_9GAST|nr:hypothetical protein PoB_002644800 [Plakobranchus ocellatus]
MASPAAHSYKYKIFNKRESGGRLNNSFDMGDSSRYPRDFRDAADDDDTHRGGITNGLGPKSLDRSFDTLYYQRQSRSPTRRVDRSLDASNHIYSSSNGTVRRDRSFDGFNHNNTSGNNNKNNNSNNNNLPSFSFSAVPPSSTPFLNQSFDTSGGGGGDGGRFQQSDRLNRSFDGRSFEHTNNFSSHSHRQQHSNRNYTTSRSGELLDRSPERRDTLERSFRAFNQAFNGKGEFDDSVSLPVANGFSASNDLRGRTPTKSALRSSDHHFEKRSHEEKVVRRTGVSLDRGSSMINLNRSFNSPGVSWKTNYEDGDDDDLWTIRRPVSFRSMVRK